MVEQSICKRGHLREKGRNCKECLAIASAKYWASGKGKSTRAARMAKKSPEEKERIAELHRKHVRKSNKTSPRRKEYMAEYLRSDKYKDYKRQPEVKQRHALEEKRARDELRDHYVKTKIGIKDAPPELIEVARLNITLKRETRQWKSKQ